MPTAAIAAGLIAGSIVSCASEVPETADPLTTQSAESRGRTRPTLTPQQSGTINRLQAISPVDARVVWASGVGGTFAVTTNGGATWRARVVPGAEALQFRDVHAVSARVAYLLSAGVGTDSRIYKTEDGGDTWSLQFENQDPNGFYDCFAFWDRRRAVTMGDSVNGRFPVLVTRDGETWQDIGDRLPAALPGEAAFAASGTCAATQGERRAWLATGAAERARVLATTDGGRTWAAYDTPIIQGTASSGAISIAFRDRRHGILGGGELATPTEPSDNFARSSDGGKTWQLATPTPFPGAIYGLSYALRGDHGRRGVDGDRDRDDSDRDDGDRDLRGRDHDHHDRVSVVATGPSGAAWSADEGDTWTLLDGVVNYWAVDFGSERTGWLVGTEGRILRIDL